MTDVNTLLERYNPVLVLLPQDTTRPRPWSKWFEKVDAPRGDYHPCSVEFFLASVVQRDHPKPWSIFSFKEPLVRQALGLPGLKELAERASPQATEDWELDVAAISSQDADEAWVAYGAMLNASPWDEPAYTYGRYVAGPPAVLEYWFLYAYNDAPNRHEGDWENIAIELDAAGEAVRAGYAGHSSGFLRQWQNVNKRNGRPLVFVARGSHASYFEHRPEGHRTNSLSPSKGWPAPFDTLYGLVVRKLQDTMERLRLVDHTASNPEAPVGEPRDLGVLVEPRLIVLPEVEAGQASDDFWWMRLCCRWGSRHSRISGTIGPNPPWEQRDKWYEPSKWMDRLVKE